MTAQFVVGLYESKGFAQDARNRLHTEGVPLGDMALVVLRDIELAPYELETERAALSVSPFILDDVERTFASFIKNGESETALIVNAPTEADAQFAIETLALYDPLAIETPPLRAAAAIER